MPPSTLTPAKDTVPDAAPGMGRLASLLDACKRGDEDAFAELYALTSPKLYALVLRILGTRSLAEDALQECYVRIWQNADQYTPERGSPMAWLATIARYRALDLLRRRRHDGTAYDDADGESEVEDASLGPEDEALQSEGLENLDECMQLLAGEQRDIVLMAYYHGYTHSEISARTGNAIGTVKTWLHRGLIKLRDCMGAA